MNLVLAISIIFVVLILYLVFVQYQKSATERAIISSRAQEINAISAIYQTKLQQKIAIQQGKATAKDWLATSGSLFSAVASIFSGVDLGLGGK